MDKNLNMYIKSNFIESEKFIKEFSSLSHINFSFFFDYRPTEIELNLNPINIFAHDEPNEYFGNHDWIEQNSHYFSVILTWSERLLKKTANSKLLVYGESWIDDLSDKVIPPTDKKFGISFIRGKKLLSSGHLLRHQIFNRQDEILINKKFLSETDISNSDKIIMGKLNTHNDMMFSLIIENTSHDNYFTEKITDAIVCKTIPIYWGCTNIEKYYNVNGIIQIRSDDEAIKIINNLTPDQYYDKIHIINENHEKAINYSDYLKRIKNELSEIFKFNKIL